MKSKLGDYGDFEKYLDDGTKSSFLEEIT